MRAFNTAGPVRADRDYQIAPLSRIDLEEVLGLIRDEKYFVLHAPRQDRQDLRAVGTPRSRCGACSAITASSRSRRQRLRYQRRVTA